MATLAQKHGLTVYDAAYLDVACRKGYRWPAWTGSLFERLKRSVVGPPPLLTIYRTFSTTCQASRNWPQDLQELTNLEFRTFVYDNEILTAVEFLRRVKKTARKRNVAYRWVPSHGKGSHGTLYFGDRLTTVQDLNAELPKGTLHVMLKQIGLTLSDIYSN
jgi:mRNA interferase HicA